MTMKTHRHGDDHQDAGLAATDIPIGSGHSDPVTARTNALVAHNALQNYLRREFVKNYDLSDAHIRTAGHRLIILRPGAGAIAIETLITSEGWGLSGGCHTENTIGLSVFWVRRKFLHNSQ